MSAATKPAIVALLAIVAVACSTPAPSPTPTRSPSPTSSPAAQTVPQPVCDPPPTQPATTLTCEKAVAAATAVLPAEHLPVLSVEFHFGSYCPPGGYCPITSQQNGFVVFATGSRGPQPGIWVRVTADEVGSVSVTSGPQPYPPILDASQEGG